MARPGGGLRPARPPQLLIVTPGDATRAREPRTRRGAPSARDLYARPPVERMRPPSEATARFRNIAPREDELGFGRLGAIASPTVKMSGDWPGLAPQRPSYEATRMPAPRPQTEPASCAMIGPW